MNQPNAIGVILIALGAALPVAIVQPTIQAVPWLETLLVIASPTVTAVALFLNIRQPKAE